MDDIVSKAKELNSTKSSSSQGTVKTIEDMTFNINIINEIFDDFQQGTNFYTNLTIYLTNLQKIVADYYFARDLDKKNRLQELDAHKAYATFNNAKPFFDGSTGQFPSGSSQFRPSNAQATYQNLTQNIGTAFSPSIQNQQNQVNQQKIQTQTQTQQATQFIQTPTTFQQHLPSQSHETQSNFFTPPPGFAGGAGAGAAINNANITSQYGYMPFQNVPGLNNPPPTNNAGGFGGFNETTSAFVVNPFNQKK